MAFLFVYCTVWVIMCGVSAWLWDGYDYHDVAQTIAIVICCALWPALIAHYIYQEVK